jgi:hypothetical protein
MNFLPSLKHFEDNSVLAQKRLKLLHNFLSFIQLVLSKALVWFDLSGNQLGTQRVLNLFRVPRSFGHLESFYLMRNEIGDNITSSLCQQIETNRTLKVCD